MTNRSKHAVGLRRGSRWLLWGLAWFAVGLPACALGAGEDSAIPLPGSGGSGGVADASDETTGGSGGNAGAGGFPNTNGLSVVGGIQSIGHGPVIGGTLVLHAGWFERGSGACNGSTCVVGGIGP